MAYITIEVFRKDFNEREFDLFHRGYQSLRLFHLQKEIYDLALRANKVFIYYNNSELILKQR